MDLFLIVSFIVATIAVLLLFRSNAARRDSRRRNRPPRGRIR